MVAYRSVIFGQHQGQSPSLVLRDKDVCHLATRQLDLTLENLAKLLEIVAMFSDYLLSRWPEIWIAGEQGTCGVKLSLSPEQSVAGLRVIYSVSGESN